MQKVFEIKGFQVIETVDGDIIISNDENGLHSKSIEEFTMSRKCDMYSRESITEYASVMTCVVNNWQHGIKVFSLYNEGDMKEVYLYAFKDVYGWFCIDFWCMDLVYASYIENLFSGITGRDIPEF